MGRRGIWQLPVAVAIAGVSVAVFGLTPAAIPALYLAAVAPELVWIDAREHRLPNRMVVPGILVALGAAVLSWVVSGHAPVVPVAAAVATSGLLLLFGLGGGVGMGDVKLAVLIGLASPTPAIAVLAPLAAFLLGGIAASVVLVRGVAAGRGFDDKRQHVAFGPFLLAGYVASVVATSEM